MWMLLLALTALAQETADEAQTEPTVEQVQGEPPAEPALEVASVAELADQAWTRIKHADYDGARILLDQADERAQTDREKAEVAYFRAISHELDDDAEAALSMYQSLTAGYPDIRTQDVAFRTAEVLGSLDRFDEAAALLDGLGELSREDNVKVNLVRSIWVLRKGNRDEGRLAIRTALGSAEPGDHSFYQAKARAYLVESYIEQAAESSFDVKPKHQDNVAELRALLVKTAEFEVREVIALKEIEWILHGLMLLGDGYVAIGDDILAAPPTKKISKKESRMALWNEGLAKKSETVWLKGIEAYELGIDLALANQWESKRVQMLQDRKQAAMDKF